VKRAANQPTGELTLFAGIFCKVWRVADADTALPQHSHEFPHLSLIVRGSVRVWCDAVELGDFHAPATVKIAAHAFHTFLTLTDDVCIACIHAVGDADEPAINEPYALALED